MVFGFAPQGAHPACASSLGVCGRMEKRDLGRRSWLLLGLSSNQSDFMFHHLSEQLGVKENFGACFVVESAWSEQLQFQVNASCFLEFWAANGVKDFALEGFFGCRPEARIELKKLLKEVNQPFGTFFEY